MAADARSAALAGLKAQRTRGTWPDQFVKKELGPLGLSRQDTALAVQLLYGTLQNLQLIDFYLAHYSSIKLRKIMPQVLDVLRLGVYQIVFLDKVPPSAAVNESVRLARKNGGERAAAFANAVLRKTPSQREALPQVDRGDFAGYLAVQYSHPLWFAQRMIACLGPQGAEALFQADNAPAPVTARVNTLKTDTIALLQRLEEEGIGAAEHPWLPDCIVFHTGGSLTESRAFGEGLYYMQDPASQLPPWALGIQPGETVLDLCAAPGGKTMIAAQMLRGRGKLAAMDIHAFKCDELRRTAARYGISDLAVQAADSSVLQPEYAGMADKVICDVPCSGMGILRKKADIRFKTQEEVGELPALQRKILDCAAVYCKPGGTICYSTCTVLPEENQQVVEGFLADHPAFSPATLHLPCLGDEPAGWRTLYPHTDGTDGFFIACLHKNQEKI